MPDTSNMSATRTTPGRHECDTKDTSATRVRNFDFDNDTSEVIPILALWQMKDYKERNNFILKTTFWKLPFVPISICISKVNDKN